MAKPLKIAVLHYQPGGEQVDPVVLQVQEALRKNGHDASLIGVDDRVNDVLRQIEKAQCDLVFNVCETFADDYRMEVNIAALMEMAGVKFTGSGTAGLLLAQDKILTKQLLEFHHVLSPRFAMFDEHSFATSGDIGFPLIVKPAKSDASIGIGKKAVVKDMRELSARVADIREQLDDDALAEEYIEGREMYVAVLGPPGAPEVLPLVELDFGKWEAGKPKVANRDVKFGPETKDSPRLLIARDISEELQERIERAATTAYRALKLRDYARMDFRVSARNNAPYLLEVNPNPYLEDRSEVALAAMAAGLSYERLVGRIVDSAVQRYKLLRPPRPSTAPPKLEVVGEAAPSPTGKGQG